MIWTRITTAVAAIAITALTLAALPGAAQASDLGGNASSPVVAESAPAESAPANGSSDVSPQAWTDCPLTYFCVWVDGNYQGPRGQFEESNLSWGSFYQSACPSGTWSNCASSGFNNGTSGMGVVVWDEPGHDHGHSRCLPKGWRHPYFTQVHWNDNPTQNINDKISSNQWTWDCHY
ncbi:peptidase inhibitor family I36 protein [Streptomyces sp. 4N124]|uniref:peptidase inhibitor family I36 protein n=1 Tax=Streptomyces sp. 4N124 TaxID=3457420 RepID=UPI003FD26288